MFGEKTAILVVAIALTIVTAISVVFNLFKLIGSTLMMRGQSILYILMKIIIQVFAVGVIWYIFTTK